MLEVNQVVKEYKGGKNWIRAVDGVTFTVSPGEIVGLIGPNGAGKTTLMRCVAGILRQTEGQIRINEFDTVTSQSQAKQGLAYVPEVPALYELLTVDEHLKFIAMCFSTLDVYEQFGNVLLERYDLIEKKDELVATLSKGMRQKLSVACAMIHRANVILLDEPMIGIDPAGVAELKAELKRAKDSGAAILVSTHLLDTAERFCDRIIIMAKGRILFMGTLEELRHQSQMEGASLEDVFLKLTGDAPTDASYPR